MVKKQDGYNIVKRVFDIFFGLIGLVPFAIAYFLLMIFYCFGENKGPIIYKQQRIGKYGEMFDIYKFRSMKLIAVEILMSNKNLYQKYIDNGYKLEAHEDPRITKLGRFIRKTSIDELPQFINVLKGEMSMVGPRPIVSNELQEYKKLGMETEFLKMKPGITGVWQTSGRSNVNYPERVYLEVSYLEKQSNLTDLLIVIKTIWKVVKKEGAF